MVEKKIAIDPKEFANAVVSGSNFVGADDVAISKTALKRYLAAYLLIEQFNDMEANHFRNVAQPELEMERLINQLKPFDFNQIV